MSVALLATDMHRLTFGLAVCLFALAGCSPGTLGSATGTGGTTGVGGTSGTGGAIGTAGAGGRSSGTTTLRLTLPPMRSFCDENPSCTTTQHLWILDSSGQALTLSPVGCQLDCGSCAAPPCPELPLIACPAGNFGVAVNSYDFTWDGSYVENGGCDPSGASVALACVYALFASPGTYVARFCATPGTLGTPDGGAQTCTTTGPQECVEVAFSFPTAQPVVITLPTD
jgi:hypothetical protein